ncbi:hypothetical protein [Promicromonospora iranensis]|uniref:Vitamin K-dependent gamma-carboxylase-like protein n=1 Tax=Promicromonospora iranensis TaxID=1105144 RepID=A0ABU2CSL2_9MICO|nr:hypothetical protein [Promicromonospora iranensis]MDR7384319.1 hypothetical protein [Promicromonospora iranensis]
MTAVLRAALTLLRRLDAALVAPGPGGRVHNLRTLLALLFGLRLATRDWTLIAQRPPELTEHLWVLGWLPGPVPAPMLTALQVAGLAGVALVLTRRAPRAGFALAWGALFVLAGLWGASGKFTHNDLLGLTVAFPLLFARAPDLPPDAREPHGPHGPSPEAEDPAWGWPPRAALGVLGCVYFLTGAQKVAHGGADWVLGDSMAWILRQGSSPFGDGLIHLVADTPVLPNLLAGGALALELSAPLWLAWQPARLPFAVAVTLMHGSIWAFLGIDYAAWALTVWAVVLATGVPARWSTARATAGTGGRTAPGPRRPAPAVVFGAARVAGAPGTAGREQAT